MLWNIRGWGSPNFSGSPHLASATEGRSWLATAPVVTGPRICGNRPPREPVRAVCGPRPRRRCCALAGVRGGRRDVSSLDAEDVACVAVHIRDWINQAGAWRTVPAKSRLVANPNTIAGAIAFAWFRHSGPRARRPTPLAAGAYPRQSQPRRGGANHQTRGAFLRRLAAPDYL
jgi:hypothetical protein